MAHRKCEATYNRQFGLSNRTKAHAKNQHPSRKQSRLEIGSMPSQRRKVSTRAEGRERKEGLYWCFRMAIGFSTAGNAHSAPCPMPRFRRKSGPRLYVSKEQRTRVMPCRKRAEGKVRVMTEVNTHVKTIAVAVANVLRMLSACFTTAATRSPPPAVEATTPHTSGVKPWKTPYSHTCPQSARRSAAA
eukprot:scaffold211046_cov35-Tisochrysis_lutea.AAC.3